MDFEEKVERLKQMYGAYGKKQPSNETATELILRLSKLWTIAKVGVYVIATCVYFAGGALAGLLLGLPNPSLAGLAFLVIRLVLNFNPTVEDTRLKLALERRVLGEAISAAPIDPAILSELLGSSHNFSNPDNTPKA